MRFLLVLFAVMLPTIAQAESTPRQDALLDGYFALLDNNSNITADTLARLYTRTVVYYGHVMSQPALLRDKLNFVRRWPDRHYVVAPGSATQNCNATRDRCELTAVLVWTTRDRASGRSGRSRIRLTLVRENGALKITRESAVTLG